MNNRDFDLIVTHSPKIVSLSAVVAQRQLVHPLLQAQRRYGNRYVQRVLALSSQGDGSGKVTPDVERAIEEARGGGQPLDSTVRIQMEPTFGVDFGSVRVHTDTQADSLNRSLSARAFTTGRDIFFRSGEYNPAMSNGRELLAHELTHVVQQNGDQVKTKLTLGQPGDRFEQEADQVARAAVQQERLLVRQQGEERQSLHQGCLMNYDQASPSHALNTHNSNHSPNTMHRVKAHQTRTNHSHYLSDPELIRLIGQNSGRKIQRTNGHATIRVWQISYLRSSPNNRDYQLLGNERIHFQQDQDIDLISSDEAWLNVEGTAFSSNGQNVGTQRGWIRREWSNLAPAPSAATENDRTAQDLDDFLDTDLLPALAAWERGLRVQGNAYLRAHSVFSDTLQRASQQAKARADFYAAILTVVCVGSLGWISDVVLNGQNWANLIRSERFRGLVTSETFRGSIEDAIQSGIGETIDIAQGGWFARHVSRETHPLHYLSSSLEQLTGVRGELIQHVGTTKSRIRRSSTPIDRANVLVQIYLWWNGARARHTPPNLESSEQEMASEFERGFWKQYILEDLTRSYFYVFYVPGYEYTHPEEAVQRELDDLGISQEAGISTWSEWYERIRIGAGRHTAEGGRNVPYLGSDDTQRLADWARSYQPRRTFG